MLPHGKGHKFKVRKGRNFLKNWISNAQLFLVLPKIQRGPKLMKVQVGQRADIPCNAQGITGLQVGGQQGLGSKPRAHPGKGLPLGSHGC